MADPLPDDGRIRIDSLARRAWLGSRELRLTRQALRLLEVLVASAGIVMTHRQLLLRAWGSDFAGEKTLAMHICLLRRALRDDPRNPRYISNFRPVGYRLEASAVPPATGQPLLVIPLPAPEEFLAAVQSAASRAAPGGLLRTSVTPWGPALMLYAGGTQEADRA